MAVAGYNSSVLIASLPSVALTDDATTTADLITFITSVAAHRYLDKSVPVVVQAQYDETQQLAITGAPTGGTFTLTFGAQTTATINWNDNAATVQTLQGGATWATITTGFTLFRANARVVFAAMQLAGTQVRFHSGNYFPYAQIAEAASCEFNGKMNTDDTTTFQSAAASGGAKSFTPTTLEGTLKYGSFWINIARAQSLVARDFLIVSFQTPPGNRYEGFCYAGDCNIKTDAGKVVTQDLVFQLTDEFFNS